MSAFKDSGHQWWQQCSTCSMAWFIGERPEDGEEHEADCERCYIPDAELSAARKVVDAARDELDGEHEIIRRAIEEYDAVVNRDIHG